MARLLPRMLPIDCRIQNYCMLVSPKCCYLSTFRCCHPFADSFCVLSVICGSGARLFVSLSVWPLFLSDYSDVVDWSSFLGELTSLVRMFLRSP